MYRSYLVTFAIFLLPIGMCLGISYLYLAHTGEFLPLSDIVRMQQTDKRFCLYGTALHEDNFPYKYEGFLATKPDVVMAGSSRSLSVRKRFFTQPFYSIGGGAVMDSVVNIKHMTDLMLTARKPKLLILGIDIWWFRSDTHPYHSARPPLETKRFTIHNLLEPFVWIAHGKISVKTFFLTALGNVPDNGECNIGIQSYEKRDGFAPDGSHYFSSLITGKQPERLPRFGQEKREMEQGQGKFVHADDINPELTQEFIDIITSLRADGVTVVPVFLPFAPTVYKEMQERSDQYRYIPKILQAFQDGGIDFLDFHDGQALGSSDCEFWDGTHGGEVTFARLLKKVHDSLVDPELKSFFNVKELDDTIEQYSGLFIKPDLSVTRVPETDFMRIGCAKRQP